MVALVPVIQNDYWLATVYILIIFSIFKFKKYPGEWGIFFGGMVLMMFFEFIFILSNVEVFNRYSLLGIMPIWLPILWGYGFVAISRVVGSDKK